MENKALRIYSLRKAKHLKQTKLGKIVGVSRTIIGNGEADPNY
ncbi:MAG: DNA-binding XRE family transcriptional regulator [Paraglaciecola sp.]|jgi:DNA-binding XRE family transcriptional regulator